jgi:hypothetical protein
MFGRRDFLQCCGAGLLGAAWPRSAAGAATAARLGDLVLRSRAVAVATSLGGEGRWETRDGSRRIVTTSRVRIDELLCGDATGSEVWVRTLGGRVGNIGQVVHGEALLLRDEPCVVFLHDHAEGVHSVTGLAQGHYPLRADAGGVLLLQRSPLRGDLVETADSASGLLVGQTLGEGKARIRSAQAHAR